MVRIKRTTWLLLVIGGWLGLAVLFLYRGLGSEERQQTLYLRVPRNATVKDVGGELERLRVMREGQLFSFYFRYHNYFSRSSQANRSVKAGTYAIKPDEPLREIVDKLQQGETSVRMLTIPEGATVFDISTQLQSLGYNKDKFLQAVAERAQKPKYPFEFAVYASAEGRQRPYRLEGYLHPATYKLPIDANEEEILDQILASFQENCWDKLQIPARLAALERYIPNPSLDSLITVASLLQSEGQVPQEFPAIAGVIYNRLQDNRTNKRLEIDAANLYPARVQGKAAAPALRIREVGGDYNTYKIPGLPPGPICSPGKEAIQSALEPQSHDFYFYVARCDRSGLHNFSTNLTDHQNFVQKYRACPDKSS